MAFDPSVIGSIADSQADPVASIGKALGIKDMANKEQLNELSLNEVRKDKTESDQVEQILKTSKYDTPEGLAETVGKVNKVSPKAGMDLMRWGQQFSSGQIQAELDKYTLASAQHDVVVGMVDPITAEARNIKNNGGTDLDVNAYIASKLPDVVQGLKSQQGPDGKPLLSPQVIAGIQAELGGKGPVTLSTLESLEARSKQGGEAIKQRIEQLKATTGAKHEEYVEKHGETMANQGEERIHQGQENIEIKRNAAGGLTEQSTDSLAEQAMAGDTSALQGMKRADKVKVRNRMADLQQIRGLTGADQAAANAQFVGVKAGERTLGIRQANVDTAVTEAEKVLPLVLAASEKLDRAKFVPWNQIFQIAERGDSNPDYYRFAQGARTLANLYTRAVVPGASGVDDRRESLKSLPVFTDKESFKATTDFMLQEMMAAKASPAAVRRDMSQAITGRDQAPGSPGQTSTPGPVPQGAATVGATPGITPPSPAAVPRGTNGATKGNVNPQTLAGYAKQHNMTPQAARDALIKLGYTVQ